MVPWLSGRSEPHYPRPTPVVTLGPCYFWESPEQKGSSHSIEKKQPELVQMTGRQSPVSQVVFGSLLVFVCFVCAIRPLVLLVSDLLCCC